MNHTWRGFESLLSGLLLKISQDLALSKQSSPELSSSYTDVLPYDSLLIFRTGMFSLSCQVLENQPFPPSFPQPCWF